MTAANLGRTAASPSELLGLREACARYAVSYSVLYKALQDGDLPAEFARGRWRVDPDDVVAWLRVADDYRTNQPA